MATPFGRAIRRQRIRLSASREELGAAVGRSYGHIAAIENGHTSAAATTLVEIAVVLRLRPTAVTSADDLADALLVSADQVRAMSTEDIAEALGISADRLHVLAAALSKSVGAR